MSKTDREKLQDICAENCTCETAPTRNKCQSCMAAGVLNTIAEIARDGLSEITDPTKLCPGSKEAIRMEPEANDDVKVGSIEEK